ncbi:MAG TPA: YcnI family protein [Actinomycetes bacterium]|nr:YcnI family protein [Actinomycetes bacterium]
MIHITPRRAALVATITAAIVVLPAVAASAHVTVSAPGATQGGTDQEITFRVPVEKDVDTVGLKVALPTDTPIADILVEPVPGWTHTEKTITLKTPIVTDDGNITEAVSEVDWAATPGHGLTPGEFGAFTVIAGLLPKTPTLTFKAIQVYADGSQVDWTQTEAPGSTAELDNPAPVLALAPAATTSGSTTSSASPLASEAASSEASTGAASSGGSGSSSTSTWALVLSVLALVAALAALGVVAARTRARRA